MGANENHAKALLRALIAAGAAPDSNVANAQIAQWGKDSSLDPDDVDAALAHATSKGWIDRSSSPAGTIRLTRAGFDNGNAAPTDA